jgi:hypothetical protein
MINIPFIHTQWQLEDNLAQKVLPSSEGGGNVTASWADLGILSHSLGGDTLIQMLQQNHTFAKVRTYVETFKSLAR